jgi:hypothetical protein
MWKPLRLTEDDAYQTADDKTEEFSIAVEEWRSRVQDEAIKQHLGKVMLHGISVGAFGAMCGKRVVEEWRSRGQHKAIKQHLEEV